MILGIGTDLCDIRRIAGILERHGPRFCERIFTEAERETCESRKARAESYARRWAAKEAGAKAIGTGAAQGVRWREIEIINLPSGQPTLTLHGQAEARLRALTPKGLVPFLHLSVSDEPPYAQAFVVIEARAPYVGA
ncbi:MAG: holo-ACP synthase [Neomegalonema sp.]|nr:holo-ACP synthase [Neomegalonema sp.]